MRNIIKAVFAFSAAALICLLSGCQASPQRPDSVSVIATNFAAYDFARELAGDNAEVLMLLSPGQESHTFEPTPQNMIQISKADLLIAGGGSSDEWVRKLIDSSELNEANILFMMDCVTPVEKSHTEETVHAHNEVQNHSRFYQYDEHVWTSPENAKKICGAIAERFMDCDKANAAEYESNLLSYTKKLDTLSESFREATESGKRSTIVFADRFPFRYLADEYGLTYFSAFPGCSDETEPDAATIKFLIDTVQSESIPAVFYTELSNRKIADALCEATNAKQLLLHSCHTVTKDEFERGETYLSLMKKNAQAIKEALS